jgi:hypothetical protein
MKNMLKKIKAAEYWEYFEELENISKTDMIERYTNIWGEQVLRFKGVSTIINPNPNKFESKISKGGHSFPGGFYNIDENGNEVSGEQNFDEYMRIEYTVELMEKVSSSFVDAEFKLCIGPNNTVAIDDVYIVPDCYWEAPKAKEQIPYVAEQIVRKVNDFIIFREEISEEDVKNLQQCVISSMCDLNTSYLSKLEEGVLYSYLFKDELIIEFAELFKKLLLKGVTSLYMKKSNCLYCYPDLNTFSFYIKGTNEFVIRYVIGKDKKENKFILEECRNKPLKIEEIFPDI